MLPMKKMGPTRIPVKLHRRVCLVLATDALLAHELLAEKKISQDFCGSLTERALLVRPKRLENIIEELIRMGHTPQVIQP